MLSYQLGFKNKLRLVIGLALIGFTILSLISFNALQAMQHTSARVDQLNQQVLLLKDLQLKLSGLHHQPEDGQIQQLLPSYSPQLQQLAQVIPAAQSQQLQTMQSTLASWVELQLQWLSLRQQIGLTAAEGLRANTSAQLKEVEDNIFASMRKPFRTAQETIQNFLEQRNQQQYQQANEALNKLKAVAVDLGFEDFLVPLISRTQTSVQQLGDAIFSMDQQGQQAQKQYRQLVSFAQDFNSSMNSQLSAAKQDAQSASELALQLIIGVCIAVAALVMGLLLNTSRDVVKTLSQLSNALHKLADGDLTQQLSVNEKRKDELDRVSQAVNTMTASLNQVLAQVSQSSQQLDSGAAQLSDNLQAMVENSLTTNEQTASVAAAIEQISVTIQDMASSSELTHQQAQQAQTSADQGGSVITDAIGSLSQLATVFADLDRQAGELVSASGRVDGVTDMINGLAEQTNLLALNAAIEAARAGEAGRGFSVVADEVRGLAEKTVQATQDINNIINSMQSSISSLLATLKEGSAHVDSGKQRGDSAADAVEQIKSLVQQVAGRNETLTLNIEEVSKATQLIAQSMDQVSGNVSENKTQSEHVQQYVSHVGEQTGELLSMTQRFRYSE